MSHLSKHSKNIFVTILKPEKIFVSFLKCWKEFFVKLLDKIQQDPNLLYFTANDTILKNEVYSSYPLSDSLL